MNASPFHIIFIASAKLYSAPPGQEPRELDSPFVRGLLDRHERDRERSSWKEGSMGWNLRAGGMAAMPGLPGGARAGSAPARFTAVAEGGRGELYYTIETSATGGLFHFEVASGDERRVFHKQQTRIGDLACHPATGMVALVLQKPDGSSHVGVMSALGGGVRELTEGDVQDGSPSWSPVGGPKGTLVYHSAGFARADDGAFRGLGPSSILALDLDRDELTTVVEAKDVDCLAPRIAPDGSLYYIRRPYHPFGPPPGTWQVLKDVLLFPYRLGVSLVYFLHFMSLMTTQKPLITAGGPAREGPDRRQLMIWGRMVDAEKALADQKGQGAIVPRDWRLVRRDANGRETEIAQSVVAFDLPADGSIVWTNGSRVLRRAVAAEAGPAEELLSAGLIERLVVLG